MNVETLICILISSDDKTFIFYTNTVYTVKYFAIYNFSESKDFELYYIPRRNKLPTKDLKSKK